MSTPKCFVKLCGDFSPDFTPPLSAARETRQNFIDRRLTRIGHWGRRLRRRRSSCRRGRSCGLGELRHRSALPLLTILVSGDRSLGPRAGYRGRPGCRAWRSSRHPNWTPAGLNRARRVSRSPSCSIPGRRSKGVVNARSPPPWSSRPPIRPSGTTPRAARARATCAQENLAFLPKLARENLRST